MAITSSPRLGITRWGAGTDPFTRLQMDASHAALEANSAMFAQGTLASRPAFGKQGRFYFATDNLGTYYDTGTAWRDVQPSTLSAYATDAELASGLAGKANTAHSHAVDDLPVAADGAVSSTSLVRANDSRLVAEVKPGFMMVCPFANSTTPPAGWLFVRGQSLLRADYPVMFANIGTQFGSSSSTTFNLPDMRGLMVMGAGAPASGAYEIGAKGGAASRVISIANLPSHSHTMTHTHAIDHAHTATSSTVAAHSHGGTTATYDEALDYIAVPNGYYGDSNGIAYGPSYGGRIMVAQPGSPQYGGHAHAIAPDGAHNHTVTVSSHSGQSGAASVASTGNAGSGTPLDTLSPYIALNWIIKTG